MSAYNDLNERIPKEKHLGLFVDILCISFVLVGWEGDHEYTKLIERTPRDIM